MTIPLNSVPNGKSVMVTSTPPGGWMESFGSLLHHSPSVCDIHSKILSAITLPTGFATITDGDRIVGFGVGVRDKGSVGIVDVLVDADHRGKGYGRDIVLGLLQWGRESVNPDGIGWLQVVISNVAACRLYKKLGFVECYRYHYRRRAVSTTPDIP